MNAIALSAHSHRALLVAAAMAGASVLAVVLTPQPIPKDAQPDIQAMIPKQFNDWVVDPTQIPVAPSDDVQQQVSATYDQLVNRTYVAAQGKRVMLTVGYGSRQDQRLKAHRQEVCYASQGFDIRNIRHEYANVGGVAIPVTRMMAVRKDRHEAVTYWFTVGEQAVQSHLQRLLAQLAYGLSGTIPDGVLVRISTLQADSEQAFDGHLQFIDALLASLKPEAQQRLVGKPTR